MLFDLLDEPEPKPAQPGPPLIGTPRFQAAVRNQVCFRSASLDEMIPQEHPVRVIWDYALKADLTPLYQRIKAVERHSGRPPIDPRILFALWLYATTRGVGSARLLDELCREKIDYQWICGDVSVNYHTLADFRRDHGGLLDDLLTQSVAVLMAEDLVDLERVAQDGMRVRASAGAASFRRQPTLEEALAEARAGRDAASGTGGRPQGRERPSAAGPPPRGRGARRTGPGGPGAAAGDGGEEEARREGQGAMLDDRPGRDRDEDGQRGVQPGVQCAVRHGHE